MLIHAGYSFRYPILRVAVPVFFIISSYFFFRKVEALPADDARAYYRRFIVRGLKLYAFWIVALMPYMIAVKYQTHLLEQYLIEFPLNFVLRSVFPASWYLAAYMICISIVYFGRRRMKLLTAIGLGLYAVCCMESNYGALISGLLPASDTYFAGYVKMLYVSFPAGLIFVVLGRFIAVREPGWATAVAAILAGGAGLAFEAHFVVANGLRVADDCYFSLLALAPGVFLAVVKTRLTLGFDTTVLRRLSTINYCSHYAIIRVISKAGVAGVDVFLLTLAICTLLGLALIWLSRRARVLRFAY